ncbi:hypothetical protein HYS94_01530 [Candidatus Daviesbacteria bacterium]|nr:hypothetical protein [Candidatus Daviesbacteria bacterium]
MPSHFSACWVFDASAAAYINNTVESSTVGGTVFTVFDATADYLYLGNETRFDLFTLSMTTFGSLGTIIYEYYNGTAWTRFYPRHQYDFTINGGNQWERLSGWATLAFSGTVPHAATPPDTTARFWIRLSVSSITTSPTVQEIVMRPYAAYTVPGDVATLLQIPAFSSSTTPTLATIEDFINRAQSTIDFKTRASWRPNIIFDEEYDFDINGIPLRKSHVREVTRLQVWDGASYQTRTQGRTSDYFVVNDLGQIYFSRFFLLPARIVGGGTPIWVWGLGEYNYPVRVSYIHGRDYDRDEQAQIIWNIATKLAAIDVYTSHDYSVLAVSGSDRVTLDRKIESWRIETDEEMDRLRSWDIL